MSVAGPPSANKADLDDGSDSKQDCHSVVKSSGLSGKKRFCCEHGHKCSKVIKYSVACQTDSTDDDLDWRNSAQDKSDDLPNGSFSSEQQTVAHEICAAKDDDGLKPEGTLRLMIHNFRNMNDTVRGPAKSVSGVPWKIMVMPRQHVVAKKGTQKCLGFFLQCCPESYSDSWLCQAAAELRLISQKSGVPNFVRKTNHIYTAKENDWGYSCFMTWADILDESQGYMKDESVILEVYVKAEPPKGILTHDSFCKKIQDYMRLADMQCSRNLIDKALEVNQTALKFCKDKDDLMKEELEKQKTKLIERKLKQSIERIEKDSKQLDSTAEGSTNLNNLRQALAGNLAAIKTAASTKNVPPGNAAAPPTALNSTLMQQNQQIKEKSAKNTNMQMTKDTAIPTTPKNELTDEVNILGDQMEDQRDVKSVVDNLVLNLSNDEMSMHQLTSTVNAAVLNDLFHNDPCCSDPSDDDDSDYEDIDEVCDSCLVEKLDNMSGAAAALVEAQDMSCQTDFQPSHTSSKSRLTPVGAAVTPNSKTTANDSNFVALNPAFANAKTPNAIINKDRQAQTVDNSPQSVKVQQQDLQQQQQQQQQIVNSQLQLGKNVTPASLNPENDKLLKLITEESKASLNSIKDTLERLVSLAQGGDSPTNGNNGQQQNSPLPFDLSQLQQHTNHQLNKQMVKTDVIDIPAPATTPTGHNTVATKPTQNAVAPVTNAPNAQQQQQQLEQQMAQIKQMIEFKHRQQSPTLVDADDVAAIQRQQFVQTDLSYVRAPSPITEEDYTLLRHAKEIVENKAEELVSRYSQLLEQSEANRLAETVKKVEKRMKDIEKQTMTCRKELSDECDRHYREEQKLNKLNKQLKQQLDQANEKVEKLNTQLKERRAEIKKLEKKLKVECQTSAENAELNSKIEQLERDLQVAKQKHNEEKQKFLEESQKLLDIKKGLQQELSCATNEMERLHNQVDEKTAQIRKLESNFKQERQQTQSSLKDSAERAKKSEVNLLEFKLEIALKTLQRSFEECQLHISQLDEFSKKFARTQPVDDMKWMGVYIQDWQKTREKIQETLQKTKTDFSQQIEAVKTGKQLSSLPLLEMPKPPAPPQAPKQFLLLNQPQEQKQPIAPIGVHPTSAGGGSSVSSSKTRSFSPNVAVMNGAPMPRANSNTTTAPSGGVGPGTLPTSNVQQMAYTQLSQQQQQTTLTSSGGATPDLGGAASVANDVGNTSSSSVYMQQNQPPQQHTPSSNSIAATTVASSNQQRNDFTLWSDPLQGLTQSLFGSKGFAGVAGFDGFGTQSSSVLNGPYQQHQTQQPPPTNKMVAAGIGQWSNWNYQQQPVFNTRPPTLQQGGDQSLTNGPVDSRNVYSRSASRPHLVDGVPSPQPSYETSMDSPISSDKSKQVDAVAEQLRAAFPNLSPDSIRDYIHEFRSMQYNRSLKGLTGEQVLNGVAALVYSRHKQQQQQQQQGSWNSGVPSMNHAYDVTNEMAQNSMTPYAGGTSGSAYDDMCTICGHSLRGTEIYTLACNHAFHSTCVTPWLSNQPNCPICCAYTVPPEEYPDLS